MILRRGPRHPVNGLYPLVCALRRAGFPAGDTCSGYAVRSRGVNGGREKEFRRDPANRPYVEGTHYFFMDSLNPRVPLMNLDSLLKRRARAALRILGVGIQIPFETANTFTNGSALLKETGNAREFNQMALRGRN